MGVKDIFQGFLGRKSGSGQFKKDEMKFVKIAVYDDSKEERKNIIRHIECYHYGRATPLQIEEFDRSKALYGGVVKHGFDIVFVCLNGLSGFETARKVREISKTCGLIIITDTANYAIEAHSLWAAHYIMKPVRYSCICDALKRCERT